MRMRSSKSFCCFADSPPGIPPLPAAAAALIPRPSNPQLQPPDFTLKIFFSTNAAATLCVAMAPTELAKAVKHKLAAQHLREGAGYLVRRAVGGLDQSDGDVFGEQGFGPDETDPFLLVDELPLAVLAPDEHRGAHLHPRLGMLSATYLRQAPDEAGWAYETHITGPAIPGDSARPADAVKPGTLRQGECLWVNAGEGMHLSEAGYTGGQATAGLAQNQSTRGCVHAFQWWVTLPVAVRGEPASVQVTAAREVECTPRVSARVLAGVCTPHGSSGTDITTTPGQAGFAADCHFSAPPFAGIQVIDFTVGPEAAFEHNLPATHTTALVYIYAGVFEVGARRELAREGETCLLSRHQSAVWFRNAGSHADGGLLLLAGEPLQHAVCRHGTLVCGSRQGLKQATLNLHRGNFPPRELAPLGAEAFPPRGIS